MVNFVLQFGSLVIEINRLLRTRLTPGNPNDETPIGHVLKLILDCNNQGRFFDRDIQLARLSIFVKNLQEIEVKKPYLITHFRKEIRRTGNTDSFYGVRFEVNVAASLIRKNIDFEKRESPDFSFEFNSESLFIECSSVRIRTEKNASDYNYKLASCIKKKVSKNYHNNKTALFIDATNIIHTTLGKGGIPDTEIMRSCIKESISGDSFGNVTIFIFLFNKSRGQYQSIYIRVDHECINNKLASFMDTYFPIGHYRADEYSVAKEG